MLNLHWRHQFASRCVPFSPALVHNPLLRAPAFARYSLRCVPGQRHGAALAGARLAAAWRCVCGEPQWLAHERSQRSAWLRSRPRTGQCSG